MAGAILGAVITGKMASDAADRNRPAGAPPIDLNRLFSAGGSSLQGGQLNLDPAVADSRNTFLNRVNQVSQPGGSFDFGSRFAGLGQEFAGNQGSLINARINPLRQNIEQRRGGLQRSLGRRGVQGTFANQALNNFEFGAGRELGDAQALATNDALMARTNLLGAEQGAESALTQLLSGTNAQMLQQELASLGLSVDSIGALLGAQSSNARTNAALDQRFADQQNRISGAVAGTVGTGVSDFFK